jgi:hypothetical protein
MPVERLCDCRLELAARDRLARQALQQDLRFIEKAGGAIAALEAK